MLYLPAFFFEKGLLFTETLSNLFSFATKINLSSQNRTVPFFH